MLLLYGQAKKINSVIRWFMKLKVTEQGVLIPREILGDGQKV